MILFGALSMFGENAVWAGAGALFLVALMLVTTSGFAEREDQ